MRALQFPQKDDKKGDFGDIEEERGMSEEDLLQSLLEEFGDDM